MEADYGCTEQYSKLLSNNKFKHIIAVSATLTETKRKVIENYIPIVMEVKMEDIEGKGIVNEAVGIIINTKLNDYENKKYLAYNAAYERAINSNNLSQQKYVSLQRRLFLGNLLSNVVVVKSIVRKILARDDGSKVIIFCNFSAQADRVSKYSYHSNNKAIENLNKFDSGEIKELALVGKIDRGVNLHMVNYAVHDSTSGSSTKGGQKTGRLRRLPIEQKCTLIFICPHYIDKRGHLKPTVVKRWIESSTEDLGLTFKMIDYNV